MYLLINTLTHRSGNTPKEYVSLIGCKPVNVDVTENCTIQCKVQLKSNGWAFVKGISSNVNDLILLLSSMFYKCVSSKNVSRVAHNVIDCDKYLGIDKETVHLLEMYMSLKYRNSKKSGNNVHSVKHLFVMNESMVCNVLSNILLIKEQLSLETIIRKYTR